MFQGKEGRYTIYVHAHPNYTFGVGPDLFRKRRIPSQPVSQSTAQEAA